MQSWCSTKADEHGGGTERRFGFAVFLLGWWLCRSSLCDPTSGLDFPFLPLSPESVSLQIPSTSQEEGTWPGDQMWIGSWVGSTLGLWDPAEAFDCVWVLG